MRLLRSVAVLTVLGVLAGAPARADGELLSVTRAGDLLDISISEQLQLSEVLDGIAAQYGIEVAGAPENETVGPLKLMRVSLQQALRELLQKRSFSVRYADGSDEPSQIIVAGVVQRSAAVQQAEQPFAGAATVLKPGGPDFFKQNPKENPMLKVLQNNPMLQKIKQCGDLLQKPENRGKKSETLVTAEGEPCPANMLVTKQ